jgi:hypothetical protein
LKITISCPSLQWAINHSRSEEIAKTFGAIGFRFQVRDVPNGQLVFTRSTPEIELATLEELLALQASLGYPIRVVDGQLVIEE